MDASGPIIFFGIALAALFLVPLFMCIINEDGAAALLIVILLGAGVGLLFTQAKLIAFLACGLLWAAAALIAAMSTLTKKFIENIKPVVEVAKRLQERATQQ